MTAFTRCKLGKKRLFVMAVTCVPMPPLFFDLPLRQMMLPLRGRLPVSSQILAIISLAIKGGEDNRPLSAGKPYFDTILGAFELLHRELGLTSTLKRKCAGIKGWTSLDECHAAGKFTLKLLDWAEEWRFVVVRERIRETKAAVGAVSIGVPDHAFLIWVTKQSEGALELCRDYNGHACVEQ